MAIVDEKWNDKMMNKLLYLYKNDLDTDFELVVANNQKPVKAHSAVLKAATNYFRGHWEKCEVPELYSRRTVEAIVYYMYSGEVTVNTMYKTDLEELAGLAREFKLNNLEKRILQETPIYKAKKHPKATGTRTRKMGTVTRPVGLIATDDEPVPGGENAASKEEDDAAEAEPDISRGSKSVPSSEQVTVKIEPEDFDEIFGDASIAVPDQEGEEEDYMQALYSQMGGGASSSAEAGAKLPLPRDLAHLTDGPGENLARKRKHGPDLPVTTKNVMLKYTGVTNNARNEDNVHATKVVTKFVNDNPHLVKDNQPVR